MTRERSPAPRREAQGPVRRAAVAIAAPLQRFFAIEAASGVVLLVAAAIALVWSNAWAASYVDLWRAPIGFRVGPWWAEQSLRFWINDGLMTAFFLVVGLEIRRELFEGALASRRQAALPVLAAIGGMVVPAGLFALLNVGRDGAAGWAIPMATDIAFAVGALTLLGRRIAPALRVLLLALAVIDDIGAIVVIAMFYGAGIALEGLAVVAVGVAAVLVLRAAGVRSPLAYVVPGAILWAGLLATGIHPTLAGVVLGLLTPVRPLAEPNRSGATKADREEIVDERPENVPGLDRARRRRSETAAPAERLLRELHPWVAFGVMPIFALANAGVIVRGVTLSGDHLWLFAGIVAGFLVGKPLGITALSLGATKLGIARLSEDITRRGVLLVGLLGGVGFTMSLFIAQLGFSPGPLLETAKLAIVVGSGLAIATGLIFGRLFAKP